MNPRWSKNPPIECYRFVNKIFFNHLKFSKSKIDLYKTSEEKKKWGKFTKLMNLYENILYIEQNEKISRAYYKLIELDHKFKLFTNKYNNEYSLSSTPDNDWLSLNIILVLSKDLIFLLKIKFFLLNLKSKTL